MTIVRQACRERRSVIEDVWCLALRTLQLLLESVRCFPKLQNLLLLLWKAVVLALDHILHGDSEQLICSTLVKGVQKGVAKSSKEALKP